VKRLNPTSGGFYAQIDRRTFSITLKEGRNRQIRKMCEALGYEVVKLHREEVAGITLSRLGEGQWRSVSKAEKRILEDILRGSGEAI
jgi:23S rRNA pseudouridine2604 synthase